MGSKALIEQAIPKAINPIIYPDGVLPKLDALSFCTSELLIAYDIQRYRLQMLIHSRLYYRMNENIISDVEFNTRAHLLKTLQDTYPDISARVPAYMEVFKDWDGSTGMNLPMEDPWVVNATERMRKYEYGKRGIIYQSGQQSAGKGNSQKAGGKNAAKQRRRLF